MAEVENLFPEDIDDFEEDEALDEEEEEIVGFKVSPYFDIDTGDFIIDGSGNITTANEIEAYIQWCTAVIATDRGKCDAYTTDIGIDYDAVFSAVDREEGEMILESEISEALECDPYGRTEFVQNVQFEWVGPDEVNISVEIVALDNELVNFNTTITR